MKITKLIVPIVALTVMNNNQVQVEATRAQCIQVCVAGHSVAAKACCAAAYFPPAFVACQLAASVALGSCIALCNANA
jgi:hypothetical protein